jgi:hypothetical protein
MKPPMDIMYPICSHFASSTEAFLLKGFFSIRSNNVPCVSLVPGANPPAGVYKARVMTSIRPFADVAVLL